MRTIAFKLLLVDLQPIFFNNIGTSMKRDYYYQYGNRRNQVFIIFSYFSA